MKPPWAYRKRLRGVKPAWLYPKLSWWRRALIWLLRAKLQAPGTYKIDL